MIITQKTNVKNRCYGTVHIKISIPQLTMKDLRKFVRDNGALDDDVKLMVYEDDGMGYGANNGQCCELSVYEDEDENIKEVQIWF